MKKLMVAIAAAAISLAGVAGTWFEAGFGESAKSTGGAWLTDGDVTAPTFEGETLVLEDAEAPVVFAADEAKSPADGNIEVSTALSFQGFQELPEIDPDAKAGVCALEGGNFWVVGYDAVGATNQWFDTGIAAVIGESVNVGVTVTNAVAGYQIGDSTLFEVPTRAEEIREVCYLGNGSVTALGADYTDKFVQIVLPEIEGLVATSDVTRAEVGATVEVWFVDGEKISSDPETKFTYTVGDDGVLTLDPAGQKLPTATDAAAKIGTVLYLTLQDAINASQADDTVTLLTDVSEKITIAADKQLTLDLNEKTLTGTDANYVINNLGTLVITGNGVVDSTAVSHNTLVRNGATGVMTIKNGTFKSARITVKNDEDGKGVCGQLTINGGTFLASSEQGTEVWDSVQNWGVATINGGEFDGYIECRAESNWNAGVMTITGGTFQKPVQTVVVFDSTHNAAENAADVALTIEGGTFNDMVMRVADVKAKAGEAANVRVDFDESMPEYVASCETLGTVTIPGKVDDELNPAIFANDESVYCEAGYETKDLGDGKYGVEEIVYVAQVGTDKFETLAAAVTAATTGQTITVLDNLAQTESIEVEGKDITFDLNGKTLTFNVSGDGFYFFNDADCSVTNGTIVMNVPAIANWYSAIYFEDAGGLVKDVTINSGNCKYGVVTGVDDYESLEGTADKTVVCENVDVTGSGLLFYAEAEKMTLDAGCSATQIGTNPAGATYSDALAAGWLGQLTVNGGAYTAEGNVIATMSSPAKITLNDGTFDGAVTITPVDPGYAEMGDHVITKAEEVELAAPEGYKWSDADEEGMQTLVVKMSMFYIGETGYDSWAEAAAAAKEGDTIKVGADAVIPNPGVLKGSVPVDLCGQSLTFQGGWLTSGSFTFVDSVGGGVLSMPNGLNCSATLDLSGLSGEQVVGINGNIKVNSSNSLVKFPEDWDLDTCKKCVNTPANGATLVVEGVAYIYDSEKGLWVPEGCYFITITEPENGTLETSATNAVPAGTTVTVTATPAEGYQLVSITTNGEAIAGAEFVMPEEDVTVAATFEAVPQSVKITLPVGTPAGYVVSNVTDGVAIDGDTSLPGGAEYELPFGAKIEIWAVPAEGFRVTGENPYVIEEVTSETAVELEDLPSVEEIPYAAQIGDQKYETLQEALNVGGEVVMLADCTEMVVVPAGVEVTLDFNGYKIDVNGWAIKNSGTLTINDGVVNAREAAITMYGDSVTTINGGTFTSADNAVIMGQGSEVNGNVKLTINGGEFNGGIVTSGYVACGVYAANSGVYAINGGTFNIVNGCGICARAGQITVGDEAVINVSGEIEGKVGDKATPIPCVALYVDRTEPPYPGYVAETDYLKATSNTLKIDELNQFWAAEADGTYSLHDDSEAVATVNDGYYLTVEGAFAALQAAEAAGVEIIESLCLAEDGIEFQFEGQSVSLAYMELLTVRKDMWLFKHFPFAGHVTLLPGKTIVAKGLADGATIDVPAGYVLNAAEPDPTGYIAYTAVPDVPAWDIVGGEGGINALVKEDGVTKYVEFTSITLTETGATVGLKAAKIDANGAEFALICKTALTDTETFTLPATLNYEKGELGDATEGLFTVTADLSGYKQLFVVGVGPKTPAN